MEKGNKFLLRQFDKSTYGLIEYGLYIKASTLLRTLLRDSEKTEMDKEDLYVFSKYINEIEDYLNKDLLSIRDFTWLADEKSQSLFRRMRNKIMLKEKRDALEDIRLFQYHFNQTFGIMLPEVYQEGRDKEAENKQTICK